MYNEKTLEALMELQAFNDLNEMCRENTEIFSTVSSPSAEHLKEFHQHFSKTDYVQGLFKNGELREAIDALEKAYSATGIHVKLLSMPEPERQAFQAQKRLEREVRFIHRLAAILGPRELPLEILSPGDQKRKRKEAAKHLRKSHSALQIVMRDEYFKESIAPAQKLGELRRMAKELLGVAQSIDDARPEYPSKRKRDEGAARARLLVNRLADACYRIYGHCDVKIIIHLTSYVWLGYIERHPDIKEAIGQALARKIDQFQRRVPNEDYEGADLLGDWSPAVTLDPPWMEA